jgi:sortase B
MRDDSMFGALHNFKNPEFLSTHPYVYIADESGCRRYEVFAAYEVSVSSAESYQLEFVDDADKQAFLDKCLVLSGGDTEIVPAPEDRILTLSTCTGWGHSTRWVIQAVLDQTFLN